MRSKARHGPCSQEALKLRFGVVGGEKIRNQAIRNQCEREVSTGCYGNKRRGHSCCCSSPSEGWLAAGKKGGCNAKQADLLLGLTPR